MSLPFFYHDHSDPSQTDWLLGEDSSRHIVQVLRMQAGDRLLLTNGKGDQWTVEIRDAHKKHCRVQVEDHRQLPRSERRLTLGVGLLKNASRMEWLLEKATEMGVHRIVPLITHRTVKEKFRLDRMQGILVSAMLQSQQCWMPELPEPMPLSDFWKQSFLEPVAARYIAHCLPEPRQAWWSQPLSAKGDALLLIGPEGDFTPEEIEDALAAGAIPVSLGSNRLRTETAAMAAVAGFYLAGE